jgi:hypothetical protein
MGKRMGANIRNAELTGSLMANVVQGGLSCCLERMA